MTDSEINEAVAKKFGVEGSIYPWSKTDNGWWHVNGMSQYCGVGEPEKHYPDYCGSIQAAWEIVEKYAMNICHQRHVPSTQEAFWLWEVQYRSGPLPGDWIIATADTAPRAIALAFLKLP